MKNKKENKFGLAVLIAGVLLLNGCAPIEVETPKELSDGYNNQYVQNCNHAGGEPIYFPSHDLYTCEKLIHQQ